jgi:uncharacterized protein (TIGR00645 family)
MNKVESVLESWIFRARWLLAPFFIGLLLTIVAVLFKFAKQLWAVLTSAFGGGEYSEIITNILQLVDSALIAMLLLIIGFSGYENFVSKLAIGEHEDRPVWMGKVGFSDLKIKLMGALVAISAVDLLQAFLNVGDYTNTELAWRVGIHMTFVASGVLFAVTDRIAESKGGHR